MLGLGEGGVGRLLAAEHQAERGVAHVVVVMDLGRALFGGILDVDHRWQRLVLDLDQFSGVARLRRVSATTKATRSPTQRTLSATSSGRNVRWPFGAPKSSGIRCAVMPLELVGGDVGAGQHRQHAGRGLRLRDVDVLDAGVRVRRQHNAYEALRAPALGWCR